MNQGSPRKLRWPKIAIGTLLLCRALLAMHFYEFASHADWPIEARAAVGLLRAAKQVFAGHTAGEAGASEIVLAELSGDSL